MQFPVRAAPRALPLLHGRPPSIDPDCVIEVDLLHDHQHFVYPSDVFPILDGKVVLRKLSIQSSSDRPAPVLLTFFSELKRQCFLNRKQRVDVYPPAVDIFLFYFLPLLCLFISALRSRFSVWWCLPPLSPRLCPFLSAFAFCGDIGAARRRDGHGPLTLLISNLVIGFYEALLLT
jgi:hypothetical protein